MFIEFNYDFMCQALFKILYVNYLPESPQQLYAVTAVSTSILWRGDREVKQFSQGHVVSKGAELEGSRRSGFQVPALSSCTEQPIVG